MDRGSKKMAGRYPLQWLIILLLVGIAVVATWLGVRAPRGLALLEQVSGVFEATCRTTSKEELARLFWTATMNTRATREIGVRSHSVCCFCRPHYLLFAGVILKLEFFLKNEVFKRHSAAVLAMLAALLVTLFAVGDFHQRWAANRSSLRWKSWPMHSMADHSSISQASQPRSSPLLLSETRGLFQPQASAKTSHIRMRDVRLWHERTNRPRPRLSPIGATTDKSQPGG